MILSRFKLFIAAMVFIMANLFAANMAAAHVATFSFTFQNGSSSDIILEPMDQSSHPGGDPDKVWSTCMGANWFTPNPPVKIASGGDYTVKNVKVKGCGPSVNTWKVSRTSDKNIYGYIQFINHYSININNGKFSAQIRNFVGVGNTKDPVPTAHPLASYATCHVKNKEYACLDKNVGMVNGGNILITVRDGHLE